MTPEEYQPLNRLYDDLVSLRDRFERRRDSPAAQPADCLLNKAVTWALENIGERLLLYVETAAPFFSEREVTRDLHGALDNAGERAALAQELVAELRQLSDGTMNRVSTAPGSISRLSPLFAGTIRRERGDLHDIANRLAAIAAQEQTATRQHRSPVVVALPVKATTHSFGGLKPL